MTLNNKSIFSENSTRLDHSEKQELLVLRKQVEKLKEERSIVLEHVSDGFWDWYPAEDIEYVSPRFWEMLGYSSEEKGFRSPAEWEMLIHPDDLSLVANCFEQHVESKGKIPFDQNVRYVHKNDHWMTFRRKGKVTKWGADGQPLRVVGTLADLTDVLETRSRAEILYSSASVGIWDWVDIHGDKEFWTPHFYELLGYTPGEIQANLSNFAKLLHPDDHERTFAMVNAHFEHKGPFDLEYRLLHKSGEYRWFRGMGEAVFNDVGKPVRMVGSIQDIHEQKIAEDEMKILAMRYELSLKSSKIGVWDWDVVENHLVWDQQMYRLYGITEDMFTSAYEAWLQGLHPDDKEAGDEHIQDALAGRAEFNTEFRVIWPSGSVRVIRAIATTMRNDQGEPLRMVGVNWDITEERLREAELEHLAENLKKANEALEQFVYFASHDLQAPLRHITSFVDLIAHKLETQLDAETSKWMGYVTSGTLKMKRLIDDLLAYSKVGKSVVAQSNIALNQVVSSVKQVLESGEKAEMIDMQIGNLPVIRGNPTQIEQLVQNLLQNAVKYSKPDSALHLEIFAEETAEHWVVHIADNGIGIPKQFQERIFQPFLKLSETTPDSTGIGLAICSKIVQRHGGTLSVDSIEGKGSTFTFSLAKDNTMRDVDSV